jgi:hypothetical protein
MSQAKRFLTALVAAATLVPVLGAARVERPAGMEASPVPPRVSQAEELSPASPTIGGFAFTDRQRARLLLLPQPYPPSKMPVAPGFAEMVSAAPSIDTAFCAGGARVPIRFESQQQADDRASGRQTSFGFDHLGGLVFSVLGPGLGGRSDDRGVNCLVTTGVYGRTLDPVTYRSVKTGRYPEVVPECEAALASAIATNRRRPLRKCWNLTAAADATAPRVLVVEFARQGDEALASLVVTDGSRLIFADQHGSYADRDGTSVWRVDDPGTIEPDWFDVLLIARRGREVVVAFSWGAPEGTVVRLLESHGDRFTIVLGESWYQAPI